MITIPDEYFKKLTPALFPLQERIIREVVEQGKRAIFTRYGSGKTRAALQALQILTSNDPNRRPWLVLCKKHTLLTWETQVRKWTGCMPVVMESDTPATRAKTYESWITWVERNPDQRYVFCIPHSLLSRDIHELQKVINETHTCACILDESRVISNIKTQLHETCIRLLRTTELCRPGAVRLVLSGNPCPETLLELWGQYLFAYNQGSYLGTNYYKYRNEYFEQDMGGYNWLPKMDKMPKLKEIVRTTSIRITKTEERTMLETHQLPYENYNVIYYEPSPSQSRLIRRLSRHWDTRVGESNKGKKDFPDLLDMEFTSSMTVLNKVRQVLGGFFILPKYTEDKLFNTMTDEEMFELSASAKKAATPKTKRIRTRGAGEVDFLKNVPPNPKDSPYAWEGYQKTLTENKSDIPIDEDVLVLLSAAYCPKAQLLKEVLEDQLDKGIKKIVIWYYYRHEAITINQIIKSISATALPHASIVNPTNEDLRRFETDDNCRVCAISIIKSEGLNELVAAPVAIYYSNTYSNEKRQQAEKRIARAGQESEIVQHIDIVGKNTIEERIYELMLSKGLTVRKVAATFEAYYVKQ